MSAKSVTRIVVIGLISLLLFSLSGLGYIWKNPDKTPPAVKKIISAIPVFASRIGEYDEITNIERREILLEDEWDRLNQAKSDLAKTIEEVSTKQKDLDRRNAELTEKEIELIAAKDQFESTLANIKEVARYYQAMDAKSAAKIIESLDNDYIIQLFRTMKTDVVAAILSQLEVGKAAAITKQMSGLE